MTLDKKRESSFCWCDVCLCVGLTKAISRFGNWLEGLAGLSMWLYSQLRFSTAKGYKITSTKAAGTWGEVQKNQVWPCKSPLPVKSHRMCLMCPATSYNDSVKWCLPGQLVTVSVPEVIFLGGWSHGHPLPNMYPNSRLPVLHKPHCLCKQLRRSEPLSSVRGWWEPSWTQAPRCQPKPALQAGLLRSPVLGLLRELCCTT